jgi:hypothetical protein
MALWLIQFRTEMSTINVPEGGGGKLRSARKDDLTVIWESIA